MIIKGGPRAKGLQLAVHLMRTDTNETVRVFGARGVFSKTVRGAMQEMEGIAAGSKATKPLYHVSINPESDEKLTDAQWQLAADRLEKALGMEGYQRLMVQHLKKDRTHMHVVWCRVNTETMKVAHHSHNYRTHEEVARSLEREFGLKRTQGVLAELDGTEKPKEKRPKTKDSMQEAVTGWKKVDAQAAILAAWKGARNGAAFQAYLEEAGYRLAAGDKRDFVVIDPAGGVHSIRSGVKGLRIAEIRERFADLDRDALPSAGQAQQAARDTYAAFRESRAPKAVAPPLPLPSVRPARPEQRRYDVLRPPPPAPSGPVQAVRPSTMPPPVPKPTYDFTRSLTQPVKQPTPPPAPVAVSRSSQPSPHIPAPPAASSKAMQDLHARQHQMWGQTLSGILTQHEKAERELARHHDQRMAGFTVEIDGRLKELNGLGSRAGAIFDRAERDREIAYLVAKRQRSLADEAARQEKAKEDLRRAQERELAEAKAKHDRLAALQEAALRDREARAASQSNADRTKPKPRDYDW